MHSVLVFETLILHILKKKRKEGRGFHKSSNFHVSMCARIRQLLMEKFKPCTARKLIFKPNDVHMLPDLDPQQNTSPNLICPIILSNIKWSLKLTNSIFWEYETRDMIHVFLSILVLSKNLSHVDSVRNKHLSTCLGQPKSSLTSRNEGGSCPMDKQEAIPVTTQITLLKKRNKPHKLDLLINSYMTKSTHDLKK